MTSSTLLDELRQQGIHCKGGRKMEKISCSKCEGIRSNKKDTCLWVTFHDDHALWKCYYSKCGWTGRVNDPSVKSSYRYSDHKPVSKPAPKVPEQKEEYPMSEGGAAWMEKRKIPERVWRRNKVHTENGSLVFPYFLEGKMLNAKYRTMDKKFRMIGGAQLLFYGLDDIAKDDTVIIVEGEMDKLAIEAGGITNVVSVPNGAISKSSDDNDQGNSFAKLEYLEHAEQIFAKKKRFLIGTDMDEAGERLANELARRIGYEKCWRINWLCKDANDTLMEYDASEVCNCVQMATAYPIPGLYKLASFERRLMDLYNGTLFDTVSVGFENLEPHYSVPQGRVTLVTGVPNSGKSEFLDAIVANVVRQHGWQIAVFSAENGKERHAGKFCEKYVGKGFFKKSLERMTLDEAASAMFWVEQNFVFLSNDTAPTLDWILETAKAAIYRYGVKGLVIDPYNKIMHEYKNGEREDQYVARFLSRLTDFAARNQIHIWIVAHPKTPPVDSEGYAAPMSLYQVSGGANWANMVDFGIIVHRPKQDMSQTQIFIKKVRFQPDEGEPGEVQFKYNIRTRQFEEVEFVNYNRKKRKKEKDIEEVVDDLVAENKQKQMFQDY